jgi:hypothetical protein
MVVRLDPGRLEGILDQRGIRRARRIRGIILSEFYHNFGKTPYFFKNGV